MIPPTHLDAAETHSAGRARWTILLRQPGLIGLAVLGVCASGRVPVENSALPFSVGEKLTYEVTLANGNKVGTSTMWIEGPVDVRGVSTYVFRFASGIRIT